MRKSSTSHLYLKRVFRQPTGGTNCSFLKHSTSRRVPGSVVRKVPPVSKVMENPEQTTVVQEETRIVPTTQGPRCFSAPQLNLRMVNLTPVIPETIRDLIISQDDLLALFGRGRGDYLF
uniref:Uncharacterized protein n=1 Tax=Caenorhabditis japonica TaxID=281687 RepID=A0A8R1ELR9_CAEJA